jgi:heme/copper-type cytochrome/quinol oxidase subunit 1
MHIIKKVKFFLKRWFCSTNHKDIGTIYLMFGALNGIVGLCFSIIIRWELIKSGNSVLLSNAQLYNVLITAHGLIMIFFGYSIISCEEIKLSKYINIKSILKLYFRIMNKNLKKLLTILKLILF